MSFPSISDLALTFPPVPVIRAAVAAVWLYEGLWCKVLSRAPHQARVVAAVPRFGPRFGAQFLSALGAVETLLAAWVLSGAAPGLCAITQTIVLATLNLNGLLWARRYIHDPAGMILKNAAFLVLAWIGGTLPGGFL